MAESFAKDWLSTRCFHNAFEIVSRSITEDYEPVGSPASEHGVTVLREEFGLDISNHESCLITRDDVSRALAVIGVTKSHAAHVRQLYPEYKDKIIALSRDVCDPWHGPKSEYLRCAHTMKPLVEEALVRITEIQSLK